MKTDIELSGCISNTICDEYRSALDYIKLDASISLIKFRKITEILVSLVAKSNGIKFSSDVLNDRINDLHKAQLLQRPLTDQLHIARKLGNQGAHPPEVILEGDTEQQKSGLVEVLSAENKRLQEAAEKARQLTIENMKDLYPLILKVELEDDIETLELEDKSWERDLIKSLSSDHYQDLLQAGKIYNLLANNLRKSDPFNESLKFDSHYIHLKQQAANCFETAIKLSIGISDDELLRLIHTRGLNLNKLCAKHSHIESLYLYWNLNHEENSLSGIPEGIYDWALEAAANRGFPAAKAYLGKILIHKAEASYDEGLSMLTSAADQGEDIAFYNLFEEYTRKDSPVYDNKKALEFIMKGVRLDGPNCIAQLGKLHHRGELVDQSNEKAKELLLKSMQIGCVMAENYYFSDYLKKESNREAVVKEDLMDLLEALKPVLTANPGIGKNIHRVGRNDPCTCGSGKKYKKCCINTYS